MEIKFTDLDIVDANIIFSKEYLTKARAITDKERLLKCLILAQQGITNAINQIDKNIQVTNKPAQIKSKKI
jgi:hypothetical protein